MKILGRLVLFGVAVLLVGCSGGDGTSPSPSVSVSATPESPSPSPSPKPGSELGLDEDQQAAVDIVVRYFKLYEDLSKDPELPNGWLADTVTGELRETTIEDFSNMLERKHKQTGDIKFVVLGADEVSHDDSGKMVKVHACVDAREIDIISVDTGKSVMPARPQHVQLFDFSAVEIGQEWKVREIVDTAPGKKGLKECP